MIGNEDLLNYASEYSELPDDVLSDLYRETHIKVLNPRMLSGPVQGKLLEFISRMIRPRYILEIGTYTGYSAICLARGLASDGKLITLEKNDELRPIAEKYFKRSGLTDSIELHNGDALEIIPKLKYSFDLVFIDADKSQYLEYYNIIFDKVVQGGYILADNVLWGGKVIKTLHPNDKETKGIKEFNTYIREDLRTENIILPVRDGLSIIRKVKQHETKP